jgi:hypothetical protein
VPAYLDAADRKISELWLLPFQPQRFYWALPDGTRPQRTEMASDSHGKNHLAA